VIIYVFTHENLNMPLRVQHFLILLI